MIEIPTLDELREIRRRLSEECGGDVQRYGRMLQEMSVAHAGPEVTKPLFPPGIPAKKVLAEMEAIHREESDG